MAVWRSITTWPEVIRWTEWESMGFMAPSGREPSVALDGMMLLGVMARPRSFIYEERPKLVSSQ